MNHKSETPAATMRPGTIENLVADLQAASARIGDLEAEAAALRARARRAREAVADPAADDALEVELPLVLVERADSVLREAERVRRRIARRGSEIVEAEDLLRAALRRILTDAEGAVRERVGKALAQWYEADELPAVIARTRAGAALERLRNQVEAAPRLRWRMLSGERRALAGDPADAARTLGALARQHREIQAAAAAVEALARGKAA